MLVDQGRQQNPESAIMSQKIKKARGRGMFIRNIQYTPPKKDTTHRDDGDRCEKMFDAPGSLGDHAHHPVVGSCKKVYFQIHSVQSQIIII